MADSSSDALVEAITSYDLTAPVRSALASANAVVIDWRGEALQGGAGFIGSVYRFAGTADDRGARSMVTGLEGDQRRWERSSDGLRILETGAHGVPIRDAQTIVNRCGPTTTDGITRAASRERSVTSATWASKSRPRPSTRNFGRSRVNWHGFRPAQSRRSGSAAPCRTARRHTVYKRHFTIETLSAEVRGDPLFGGRYSGPRAVDLLTPTVRLGRAFHEETEVTDAPPGCEVRLLRA